MMLPDIMIAAGEKERLMTEEELSSQKLIPPDFSTEKSIFVIGYFLRYIDQKCNKKPLKSNRDIGNFIFEIEANINQLFNRSGILNIEREILQTINGVIHLNSSVLSDEAMLYMLGNYIEDIHSAIGLEK